MAASLPATTTPFTSTSRWLRGRIVDRLRAAEGDRWTVIGGPIGSHDPAAVTAALKSLAHDGLVELDNAGLDLPAGTKATGVRVRLSLS
jgi:hypothetical protein